MEAEPASETLFLKKNTGRWIKSKSKILRFFTLVKTTQARCFAMMDMTHFLPVSCVSPAPTTGNGGG
jgi:hypothetical protein